MTASIANFFWPWSGSGSKKDEPEKAPEPQKDDKPPSAPSEAKSGYKFKGGVHVRPHDDKVYKGGEDAWCANETLIAVADGVGGWADKGVDPGLFSK